MPQAMIYRRDARLLKGQRARRRCRSCCPQVPKEWTLELIRPDGMRADETWQASLRTLDPHQMLIVVLSEESTTRSRAGAGFGGVPAHVGSRRSRRPAIGTATTGWSCPWSRKAALSPHPLTWTTISHVIWDGMPPETLAAAQQEAMLDWLHWGGQIILVGGATPGFTLLRDSFLDPYLPADPLGETCALGEAELQALSAAYPPPIHVRRPERAVARPGERRRKPSSGSAAAIRARADPPAREPAALRGGAGAAAGVDGDSAGRFERPAARGRAAGRPGPDPDAHGQPDRPALATWPGLDTLVRRVDPPPSRGALMGQPVQRRTSGARPPPSQLSGPELSWFRLLSRDFASSTAHTASPEADEASRRPAANPAIRRATGAAEPRRPPRLLAGAGRRMEGRHGLPRLCRDELERASGITIPSSTFVLKVILAYLFALVPLNWLICRYVLGRRELAWVVVPVLVARVSRSASSAPRRTTWATTRRATRSTWSRSSATIPGPTSAGSPRSIRRAGSGSRSRFPAIRGAGLAAGHRPLAARRGRHHVGLAVVPVAGARGLRGAAAEPGDVPVRADGDPLRIDHPRA